MSRRLSMPAFRFAVPAPCLAALVALFLATGPDRALSQLAGDNPKSDAPTAAGSEAATLERLSPEIRAALRERDDKRLEPLLIAEIEKTPESPELLVILGGVFFRNGKYLNAAIAYKKAETLSPLDDNSRFTLAMAYVVLERRDWAQPELEKLAKENPRNALYRYWLGRLDYDGQRFRDAIGKLEHATRLDPALVKAYDRIALCYEALGDFAKAEEMYRQAVDLNRGQTPGSAWPAANLGNLLYALGRPQEAEAFLMEALRYDPPLAEAHYKLGALLEKNGQAAQAIEHLNQAASLAPEDPRPHYALGRIYQRLGETTNALEALRRFKELEGKKERRNQ